MATDSGQPRAFVSYSWSDPAHEKWVEDLCGELMGDGVDIILDKWSLREGQDTYKFMELMVTDESVDNVIIISDRRYAEKADQREGGVGTETQIISPELYSKADQSKFVAVVTERDDSGEVYLPVFYKGRKYIDMSTPETRTGNYDDLVRCLYGKPLKEKPRLGKPPGFLGQDNLSLGTSSRARRALNAIHEARRVAIPWTEEYFELFAKNLPMLDNKGQSDEERDNDVLRILRDFVPYRDEVVQVFLALSLSDLGEPAYRVIRRFLERLLPLIAAGDHFQFIAHELLLYVVASMLEYERFDGVDEVVGRGFFVGGDLKKFTAFRAAIKSLERLGQKRRRISLHADLLKERANIDKIGLEAIMQADFVLFVRSELEAARASHWIPRWFPVSLLYATDRDKPFESFLRGESGKYFDRLKVSIGAAGVNELRALASWYEEGGSRRPSWGGFDDIDPFALMNLEKLTTRP